MDKKTKAQFKISETFKITGRGLVFAGEIIDGNVNSGDSIEFTFSGQTIVRKIKGINLISRVDRSLNNNVGLLISCINKKEMEDIRNSPPNNTLALIYTADT